MKITLCILLLMISGFAKAQMLNGDFENWHTDSFNAQKLDNWRHYQNDADKSTAGFTGGTWRVTNAYSGTYALKISRWYASDVDNVRQQAAISQKPASLTGYYIYEDPNLVYNINGGTGHITDTALVLVQITRWNSALQRRDTIGSGVKKLWAVAAYTPFTLAINYTSSGQPDSAVIALFPSSYPDTSTTIVCHDLGPCSYLTIDHLELQTSTAVIATNASEKVEVFPNPAYDQVFLRYNSDRPITVCLVNPLGAVVRTMNLTKGLNPMDIQDLASGIYFLKIEALQYRMLKL